MTIRTRFGLTMSLGIAVSMAVVLSAAGWLLGRTQSRQILAQQRLQAQMLGLVIESLAARDPGLLDDYLRILRGLPGIEYALVTDAHGNIAAHTDREFAKRPLAEWESSNRGQGTEWRTPVMARRTQLQEIRIGFSQEHQARLEAETRRAVLLPIGALGLVAITLSFIVGFTSAALLTLPIKNLIKNTRQIARGNLAVWIQRSSNDEIGELEEQFNEMAQQLRRLDDLKEQFIASLSHDLREPLAAIENYARSLKDGLCGPVVEEQQNALEIMAEGARTLQMSVNNLMELVKMKSGRFQLELEPMDVAPLISRITGLFKVTARTRGIELRHVPAKGLPIVKGERNAFERILSNLISNGIKYTQEGGCVSISAASPDGKGIVVAVTDTGRGMTAEQLSKLFQPFERASTNRKQDKVAGVGLGLTIARRFVEAQGGELTVQSTPGKGTTFAFTLVSSEG